MKLSVVDIGFFNTKGIIDGVPIITKSVVGEGKKLNFGDLDMGVRDENRRDRISSIFDNETYFLSDLAIAQSETIYHSLKANRFESRATKILLDTISGMGFKDGNHASYVVSGLPVSHYSQFKNDIKALFLGDNMKQHDFEVDCDYWDRPTTVSIKGHFKGSVTYVDGKFIPQPFGAAMYKILSKDGTIGDKSLANKTIAIIDPGFGTTDIYVINSLSPVERLTFSTDTAMNHSYKNIGNKIQENCGVDLPLYAIENVVQKREFRKNGHAYDMTKIIEWAYRSTGEQLVAEILNKWKTLHEIDEIFIAGGGGYNLSPTLMKEFDNIQLIGETPLENIWAVAKGYEKWGRRTWKNI